MTDDIRTHGTPHAAVLEEALRATRALRWPPCAELRHEVRVYAARERGSGAPFNAVRRTVKRMVGEACLREGRHEVRLLLAERAVDWALDGYYRLRESGADAAADGIAPVASLRARPRA